MASQALVSDMKDKKKTDILELCSEDATNSWSFWSSEKKTDGECMEIVRAIEELVKERKLISLQHLADGSFVEKQFDAVQLENEVRESMTGESGPDTIYWFAATAEGKAEDMINRARS